MVSRPTRGTNLRLTASRATSRTVQRARRLRADYCTPLRSNVASGALLITAANVADGLCRQRNYTGNARRGDAFGQLQKRQGAQNNPNLLNPTAEDLGELLLIFL